MDINETTKEAVIDAMREYNNTVAPGSECGAWQDFWADHEFGATWADYWLEVAAGDSPYYDAITGDKII